MTDGTTKPTPEQILEIQTREYEENVRMLCPEYIDTKDWIEVLRHTLIALAQKGISLAADGRAKEAAAIMLPIGPIGFVAKQIEKHYSPNRSPNEPKPFAYDPTQTMTIMSVRERIKAMRRRVLKSAFYERDDCDVYLHETDIVEPWMVGLAIRSGSTLVIPTAMISRLVNDKGEFI